MVAPVENCPLDADKDKLTITRKEYEQLKAQETKARESWERLLRAQAEFDNIKKRLEKERREFVKFANEGLIADLLTVLDDLERSVKLAQGHKEDYPSFLEGIEMILNHLYELLKKRGLKPIVAQGEMFDPHLHEAFLHQETDEFPERTIVEELQKGYLLEDKVIRTAKVKVAKNRGQKTEGGE